MENPEFINVGRRCNSGTSAQEKGTNWAWKTRNKTKRNCWWCRYFFRFRFRLWERWNETQKNCFCWKLTNRAYRKGIMSFVPKFVILPGASKGFSSMWQDRYCAFPICRTQSWIENHKKGSCYHKLKPWIVIQITIVLESLNPDRSSKNAYIVFASADSVAEALKLNGTVLEDHHIHVDISSGTSVC